MYAVHLPVSSAAVQPGMCRHNLYCAGSLRLTSREINFSILYACKTKANSFLGRHILRTCILIFPLHFDHSLLALVFQHSPERRWTALPLPATSPSTSQRSWMVPLVLITRLTDYTTSACCPWGTLVISSWPAWDFGIAWAMIWSLQLCIFCLHQMFPSTTALSGR